MSGMPSVVFILKGCQMIPTELRVGRTVAVVWPPWSGRGLESQRIQRLSCARSRPDQGVRTTTAGSVGNDTFCLFAWREDFEQKGTKGAVIRRNQTALPKWHG